MTEKARTIDPLLTAMLDRLAEVGPKWNIDERDEWCRLFAAAVVMLYPGKPRRKSRAKKETT